MLIPVRQISWFVGSVFGVLHTFMGIIKQPKSALDATIIVLNQYQSDQEAFVFEYSQPRGVTLNFFSIHKKPPDAYNVR